MAAGLEDFAAQKVGKYSVTQSEQFFGSTTVTVAASILRSKIY